MLLSDQIALIIKPLVIPWKMTKLPSEGYLTMVLKTLDPFNPLFLHAVLEPEDSDIIPKITVPLRFIFIIFFI